MPRLDEIIGHEFQIEELKTDLEKGNVSHAYLFSGVRHLGKMTVARAFARELLLTDVPKEKQEVVAKQVKKLTHPDYLVLDQLWMEGVCDDWEVISRTSNAPQQERAKNKAKTDVIGIDDVRALSERLHETSTGKYQVCIIRSIERMQDPAANAFLKILEEPPRNLVFLLTTQAPSSLLPTIVSRTRRVRFHRIPRTDLFPTVKELSDDDATFVLHLAQGAPGSAITLTKDPDALRQQRILHSTALSFWRARSLRERLQLLKPLHERGEEAQQFLIHLAIALREHSPKNLPQHVQALTMLSEGLHTNAHRQLLSQRFAVSVQ